VTYGYAPLCMASAFCVFELLVENYGKHLANSNRSTPLSESRAPNLSSPLFVF
jgi:neutral trehalase